MLLKANFSGIARNSFINHADRGLDDKRLRIFVAARAIARGIRLLRRRSQREKHLRSLLLSTVARDFPTLAAISRGD
jgi:hypothetical protein